MALVYKHIRKDNNQVFYIGIGKTTKRPYSKQGRNQYWNSIVNKHGYDVELIKTNISWQEACEMETLLIKEYGRKNLGLGNLVNMTDGGDGFVNVVFSDEHKKNLSKAAKGKVKTEKHRQSLSKCKIGKKLTKEHSENISKGNMGKTFSDEAKQKISKSNIGKKHSEETKQKMRDIRQNISVETKQKMSEAQLGKTRSEETKQKMRESHLGQKRSEETCQKIKQLKLEWWEKRKEEKISNSVNNFW